MAQAEVRFVNPHVKHRRTALTGPAAVPPTPGGPREFPEHENLVLGPTQTLPCPTVLSSSPRCPLIQVLVADAGLGQQDTQ